MRLACLTLALSTSCAAAGALAATPLTLIVMDPLAAPLACDCVQGYAQRKYEALGEYLQQKLTREVRVIWSESLADGLRQSDGRADLVIGKHSVVLADAASQHRALRPVAQLTGKDGSVTQTGLLVVRRDDPARGVADLTGYRVIFGPADCDEKSAAAKELLRAHAVVVPDEPETAAACSAAAAKLMELPPGDKAAAVISSYAQPLLEGCGTIQKGDLRIVGQTKPVPFITAFLRTDMPPDESAAVVAALLDVGLEASLLRQLETATGFEPWHAGAEGKTSATTPVAPSAEAALDPAAPPHPRVKNPDWPGWRGHNRDGRVAWLPDRLPPRADFAWRAELPSDGVGGVAVASGRVVVGSRDALDRLDLFQCFDAADGKLLWQHVYPAAGKLDYGNSPRATPLVHEDYVYTLGAFGHVTCLELAGGLRVWQRDLTRDFAAAALTWGHTGSPILVGHHLIVQPGGSRASLVALDAERGEPVWTSAGIEASYSSLVRMEVGGAEQLVGYDARSLGGWDPLTGQRRWQLVPPRRGDFNVPTVVAAGDKLLVTSENNGTRLYAIRGDGTLNPDPVGINEELAPDSHSPLVVGPYVYGVWNGLYQLELSGALRTRAVLHDDAFDGYASLIASDNRLLVLSRHAELLLVALDQDPPAIVSRLPLGDLPGEALAHPAVAGSALYVRLGTTLARLDLE
jgi:outer membrane protein assembly factor BamB/ABC-type phosphate/phosphonate transport system substrate-binding protein